MNKNTAITIGICLICVGSVFGTDSSVPHLKADQVHALGFNGFGVTVAVIDTGVDLSHPGLSGHLHGEGTSFEGGVHQGDAGEDVYGIGHGTYMALIIADPSGVAPGAEILSVGVFGPLEEAADIDILRAIQYVIRLRNAYPSIRVINLSLGGGQSPCQCDNDSAETRLYQDNILAALNAGIVTFAATGNDAECGWISEPACVSAANKVAASYDGGYPTQDFDICSDFLPQAYRITCFSNITDDCNYLLAAPGFDISLYVGQGPPLEFGGVGTSQATAHASGVAALMYSKLGCGNMTGAEARAVIFNTADEYWWQYPYCALPPPPKHINALDAVNGVSTGTSAIAGDLDCDGTVSLFDMPLFTECMTSPGGGPVNGFCASGDFPASPPDGDVDLRDFAGLQRAFTGFGSGACCHDAGNCTVESVGDCLAEWGTTYFGHGTTCGQVSCQLPDHGACCQASGTSCTDQTSVACGSNNGLYMGGGTTCSSFPCPIVRYRNVVNPSGSYVDSGPGMGLADDIVLSGSGGGEMVYYDLKVLGGGGGLFSVTVGLYTNFINRGGTLIAGTERVFTNLPDNWSPVFISAMFEPPIAVPQSVVMVARFSNRYAGWVIAGQAETGFTDDAFGLNVPPWDDGFWFEGDPYAGFWANVAVTEGGGSFAASQSASSAFGVDMASGGDYRPVVGETRVATPRMPEPQPAEEVFDIRELGAAIPTTTLVSHSTYELRSVGSGVATYVFTVLGDSRDCRLIAGGPGASSDGMESGNFIWVEASEEMSLYDFEGDDYYLLNAAADAGEAFEDHLLTFSTTGPGALVFDLIAWEVDDSEQATVMRRARGRFVVED